MCCQSTQGMAGFYYLLACCFDVSAVVGCGCRDHAGSA
jgi:hypothetical protein